MNDDDQAIARPVEGGRWMIYCPACEMAHVIDQRWTFNGDRMRPTFSPSLLVSWDFGESREPRRCHSFIRDGRIEYLSDCTHSRAGTTVELPPAAYSYERPQ